MQLNREVSVFSARINNGFWKSFMSSYISQGIADQVLNKSPLAMVIANSNEIIIWVNSTFCQFLGIQEQEALGEKQSELFFRRLDRYEEHSNIWQVRGDSERWLLSVDSVLEHEAQNSTDVVYFVDATELMRLRTECQNLTDQLQSSITKDRVTGLLNSKALMQALDPQVSRSRRYQNPLSLVKMQIDGFNSNRINVSLSADQVLKAVSFYLRDQLRWVDQVGRTDDMEFTFILPETDELDARKLIDKIASRLAALSLPDNPEVSIAVHARFGSAQWKKGDDALKLFHKVSKSVEQELIVA